VLHVYVLFDRDADSLGFSVLRWPLCSFIADIKLLLQSELYCCEVILKTYVTLSDVTC
jgi:hypothetical protein